MPAEGIGLGGAHRIGNAGQPHTRSFDFTGPFEHCPEPLARREDRRRDAIGVRGTKDDGVAAAVIEGDLLRFLPQRRAALRIGVNRKRGGFDAGRRFSVGRSVDPVIVINRGTEADGSWADWAEATVGNSNNVMNDKAANTWRIGQTPSGTCEGKNAIRGQVLRPSEEYLRRARMRAEIPPGIRPRTSISVYRRVVARSSVTRRSSVSTRCFSVSFSALSSFTAWMVSSGSLL